MEMPVIGFVYHHPESEGEESHTHDLYLVSWDGRQVHVHNFSGVTSYDVGHRHSYIGKTAPAPSGVPHTHSYYTVTTFDDGHSHKIQGVTGPGIPLKNGGHIHLFEGYTTLGGSIPHTHYYSGRTTP